MTERDFRDAAKCLWSSPQWDDCLYEINDFSDARSIDVHPDFIKAIPSFDKAATTSSRRSKIALVSAMPMIIPMLHLYEKQCRKMPYKVCLFPTLKEARLWVGGLARLSTNRGTEPLRKLVK